MAKKVGEVHVDIVAKLDKLDRGLKAAEDKSEKAAGKIENASNKAAGSFTDAAAKALAAVGAVEAGVKAITAASDIFTALTSDGEKSADAWDRVAETVKTLPFGLGAVASALEQMLGTITGISREVDKFTKRAETANKKLAQGIAAEQAILSANRGTTAAQRRLALAGEGEDSTARLRMQRDFAIEDAQSRFNETSRGGGAVTRAAQRRLDAELEAIQREFEIARDESLARRRELWAREDAAAEAEMAAQKKRDADVAKKQELQAKRMADIEEKKVGRAVKDADSRAAAASQQADATASSSFGVATALGTFKTGAKVELSQLTQLEKIAQNTRDLVTAPGALT